MVTEYPTGLLPPRIVPPNYNIIIGDIYSFGSGFRSVV